MTTSDLYRFTPEQQLLLLHALFEVADLGSRHFIIGAGHLLAAFAHQLPPWAE